MFVSFINQIMMIISEYFWKYAMNMHQDGHKSFLIRDLLGDVLQTRQGIHEGITKLYYSLS